MSKPLLDPQPYVDRPAAGGETCAVAARMVRSSRFKELHGSSLNEAMQIIATVSAGAEQRVAFASEALPLKHWQAARTALLRELLGCGWLLERHDQESAELRRDAPPTVLPAPQPGLLAVTSDDEVFAAFREAARRHGLPAARVRAAAEIPAGHVYDVAVWDGAALAEATYGALCRHALALIWVENPAAGDLADGSGAGFGRAPSPYQTHRDALSTHSAAIFDRVMEQCFGRPAPEAAG